MVKSIRFGDKQKLQGEVPKVTFRYVNDNKTIKIGYTHAMLKIENSDAIGKF